MPQIPQTVCGITPACAGISRAMPFHDGMLWDHPRVRGDKFRLPPCNTAYGGSPPRARG